MKRNKPLFIVLCVISGVIITLSFSFLFGCLTGSKSAKERAEYYDDVNNYYTAEYKVTFFEVYHNAIVFTVKPIDEKNKKYEVFIEGKNFDIVIENGLTEILEKDIILQISTTPSSFDQLGSPIAGLNYNGKEKYWIGKFARHH